MLQFLAKISGLSNYISSKSEKKSVEKKADRLNVEINKNVFFKKTRRLYLSNTSYTHIELRKIDNCKGILCFDIDDTLLDRRHRYRTVIINKEKMSGIIATAVANNIFIILLTARNYESNRSNEEFIESDPMSVNAVVNELGFDNFSSIFFTKNHDKVILLAWLNEKFFKHTRNSKEKIMIIDDLRAVTEGALAKGFKAAWALDPNYMDEINLFLKQMMGKKAILNDNLSPTITQALENKGAKTRTTSIKTDKNLHAFFNAEQNPKKEKKKNQGKT